MAHLISVDHGHRGPAHHLNHLISAARTEWVAILPDDDLLDPDHLESLAAVSADADIVYSWGRITGRRVAQYRGPWDPYRLVRGKDAGIRGVFLLRKALWDALGGYDEGVTTDDWDFLVRAASDGARFRLVPRETWTYRFHGGNVSDAFATGEPVYYLKNFA